VSQLLGQAIKNYKGSDMSPAMAKYMSANRRYDIVCSEAAAGRAAAAC
jgi:hypothetical protein